MSGLKKQQPFFLISPCLLTHSCSCSPPPIPLQSTMGLRQVSISMLWAQSTTGYWWKPVGAGRKEMYPLHLEINRGTCFQGSGVGILPGTQGCHGAQDNYWVRRHWEATWCWHRSSAKIEEEKTFFNQDRCEPSLKVMNIMIVNIKLTKGQNTGIRGMLFEGKYNMGSVWEVLLGTMKNYRI